MRDTRDTLGDTKRDNGRQRETMGDIGRHWETSGDIEGDNGRQWETEGRHTGDNGRQWETMGDIERDTRDSCVETSKSQTLKGRKSYILETVGNRIRT